jgi:hypothetical protein
LCKQLFCLISLIMVLNLSTTSATAELVSHWTFDEGSGNTAYDSANGNHGIVYGATWTAGKINGGLYFDGVDDYVDVQDDPSLRFGQYDSFSISFWANPLSDGYVLTKMRASHQRGYFGYEISWSDSKFYFTLDDSFATNVNLTTPEGSAPAGNWYFVTAVYDYDNSKKMQIYLNGELCGSRTFYKDTGYTAPDKNLAIGARSYDSVLTRYFSGTIDDVRIYNHAIPEPATVSLLGFGGLSLLRKRKVSH